ncbi:transcriptional repressor LexA [Alcaligenes endophyticus]|uniref:LexA repressor n=1 Tax=Alcaligenes endophyticus TaxID=1929088 RepID=A0ABT8EIP9_9BURK|nr:transcriptional repressor LexA [Alcaligenes endophyticus]MCX5592422.1 transcriptional repressor LexA [Alcaligenes endophyticus]MDN4121147.1 transcriptional repressor LexA [Alcaligenes endophyticus]
MIKLTARQQQVLDIIRTEIERTGFPPTRAEIAQVLGFRSANAAEDHLKALARKGAIELTAGASRGIRLLLEETKPMVESLLDALTLPVIGRVSAGSPILAAAHIEREIGVNSGLFSHTPDYLLRVRGLSMRDAGILEGDLLAVKKVSEARHGQIIVARIGDDVTVKRLHRSSQQVMLLPENPDFEPIIIDDPDSFSLEGIAVGLIRTTPLN